MISFLTNTFIETALIENSWMITGVVAGFLGATASKVYKSGSNWLFSKTSESKNNLNKNDSEVCKFLNTVKLSVNQIRDKDIRNGRSPFYPGRRAFVLIIPAITAVGCHCIQNFSLIQSAGQILIQNAGQTTGLETTCPLNNQISLPSKPQNCCLVQDIPLIAFEAVIIPGLKAMVLPIFYAEFCDILSTTIRSYLKELSSFRGIDISGHGEIQGLFSIQAMLTMKYINKLGITTITNLCETAMIPIILSDMIWVYETTSGHYHSVAEVATGLGCAVSAHVIGSLFSMLFK